MKTFIEKVVQDRLGYLSKSRPEGRRKMILIGEIRRGFLEEVALTVALKDTSSTHRHVGKGNKPRQQGTVGKGGVAVAGG